MSGVKKGAAIVSTPKGEILALVSKPSFDPNLFTMGESYKIASNSAYLTLSDVLMDGQNQPLLDRAIGGTYPPGSTDGQVNVVKGIKRSNDIFFYKLAEKVGVDQVSVTAKQFGLGQKLGIDLAGEQAGVVPTEEWKLKNIGEQWYLGDTYHYGIGQGYLLTTPLQVNAWTQAIANDGTLYVPHLLKSQISNRKIYWTKKVSF